MFSNRGICSASPFAAAAFQQVPPSAACSQDHHQAGHQAAPAVTNAAVSATASKQSSRVCAACDNIKQPDVKAHKAKHVALNQVS